MNLVRQGVLGRVVRLLTCGWCDPFCATSLSCSLRRFHESVACQSRRPFWRFSKHANWPVLQHALPSLWLAGALGVRQAAPWRTSTVRAVLVFPFAAATFSARLAPLPHAPLRTHSMSCRDNYSALTLDCTPSLQLRRWGIWAPSEAGSLLVVHVRVDDQHPRLRPHCVSVIRLGAKRLCPCRP